MEVCNNYMNVLVNVATDHVHIFFSHNITPIGIIISLL